MAVDMEKVKKKAEEEAKRALQRSFGETYFWWTAKNGKNRIRFMPPWTVEGPNANQFWREIYQHWNVGATNEEEDGKNFICPLKTPFGPGGPCDICEAVDKLRATKAAPDAELANLWRAKVQYLSNVVDLNDPVITDEDVEEWKSKQNDKERECPFEVGDTKVQVFGYGTTIYKELLDVFCDHGVDITDLKTGRNVTLTRETPNPKKPRETKYRLSPDFEPSVFPFKGESIDKALINLDGVKKFPTVEQMREALNGTFNVPQSLGTSSAPALPAASKPVTTKSEVKELDESEAPACFKDLKTCSDTDVECIGGKNSEGTFDPCPFFEPCSAAKVAALKPATPSRRTAKKPAGNSLVSPEVEELEKQMRNALKQ